MIPLRKFRPRPSWKPRTRFALKAKPRSTRGILRKDGHKQLSLGHAAAGKRHSTSGRRVNRLPEWTDPRSYITQGGRHRLYGEDYQRLRSYAHERAGGRCECDKCATLPVRRPALWGDTFNFLRGDFAHNEHGSRKSDELHRGKWKNRVCHMNEHNAGGKPCPKKGNYILKSLGEE